MNYYLGVDLGGTNIAVGVVDEDMRILGRGKKKTNAPRPAQEIVEDIVSAISMALEQAELSMEQIQWIGVGTPGSVDIVAGVVGYAANLGFLNTPLASMIGERTGKQVYLGNDGNAAAYGEALAGHAKGAKDVVMVTLGTGFGSGIVIDGRIYTGYQSKAGEIGHAAMVYNGRPCTCGRKGCIEAYCSATGLISTTREYMERFPQSQMWELAKKEGDAVSGRTAFDAMRSGDEAGAGVVEEYINHLGCALANIVDIFAPEYLVVGGGICNEGETLMAPLRRVVEQEIFDYDPQKATKLVTAALGNDAGILGAAFLGKA
ncbi:ROK family protein [Oscillospiraceae bacterium MB08-C2-2]|nr:ROK family protein [Oscillospiraceae bacterium MB08-C2-2]